MGGGQSKPKYNSVAAANAPLDTLEAGGFSSLGDINNPQPEEVSTVIPIEDPVAPTPAKSLEPQNLVVENFEEDHKAIPSSNIEEKIPHNSSSVIRDLPSSQMSLNDSQKLINDQEKLEPKSEENKSEHEDEPFSVEKNGYSWDWCMVFKYEEEKPKTERLSSKMMSGLQIPGVPLPGFPFGESAKDSRILTFKQIVKSLRSCKFDTVQFYSIQRDEIICLIRMPIDVIKYHADIFNYTLLLDEKKIEAACAAGIEYQLNGETEKIAGFTIYDGIAEGLTTLRPYEYLFAPYYPHADDLYFTAKGLKFGVEDPFTSIDRLKIMKRIIEGKGKGNCGIDLDLQRREGILLSYYPLHDKEKSDELEKKWLHWSILPWNTPGDLIKEYFGERIALYFLFLSHYATWLVYSSFFGLLVTLHLIVNSQIHGNLPEAVRHMYSVPFYCFFIALWTQGMLEYWKRKQTFCSLRWGTTEFEETEALRPEFFGKPGLSIVDGTPTIIFSQHERTRRYYIAMMTISAQIVIVIGCFAAVFYFKFYSTNIAKAGFIKNYGATIADIANAVQIQVVSYFYRSIAQTLTEFENNRTDTEFEDSLVTKLFYFEFINSYLPAFYTAFIKRQIGDECAYNSCFFELSKLLLTLFLTKLAMSNIIGRAIATVNAYMTRYKETGSFKLNKELSAAENEYHLAPNDDMNNLIGDYNEISIQYGFMTLFIAACPFIPIIALSFNYFEIKNDGAKMLLWSRRPFPVGAEDIGSWYHIFEMISIIAVFTNAGIVFYTMDLFADQPQIVQLWLGFVFIVGSFGCRGLVAYLVSDNPEELDIQLRRQEHVVSKIIERQPDDEEIDHTVDDDENDHLLITEKFVE